MRSKAAGLEAAPGSHLDRSRTGDERADRARGLLICINAGPGERALQWSAKVAATATMQHAEKEDFSMSPVLDKYQSPEFSEPYRLLAPLVLLSFPSGIALPSLRPSEGAAFLAPAGRREAFNRTTGHRQRP